MANELASSSTETAHCVDFQHLLEINFRISSIDLPSLSLDMSSLTIEEYESYI